MYTVKCIRCGRPAVIWGGHVVAGTRRKKITAGWCGNRCAQMAGFHGHFLPWMGTVRDLRSIPDEVTSKRRKKPRPTSK